MQVQGQVQGQAPVIQFDLFGPCLYAATVVLSCDKVVGQPGPSGHPYNPDHPDFAHPAISPYFLPLQELRHISQSGGPAIKR